MQVYKASCVFMGILESQKVETLKPFVSLYNPLKLMRRFIHVMT